MAPIIHTLTDKVQMINQIVNQLNGGGKLILDIFSENKMEIVISYLPVWEMFFSMHVLANSEHHTSRTKWSSAKGHENPELVNNIKELGALTNEWTIIIDSDKWNEVRQMNIVEMLSFFKRKNIFQWNDWIKYSEKIMSIEERNKILQLMEQYYHEIFKKEEIILKAYLIRILKEEAEKCKKEGVWVWSKNIHSRLSIEQDAIVYMKNREYRFQKNELNKIFVTVSTFVSPHLWLYENNHELEIVKGISVEQIQNDIPNDLMLIFKVLGNTTRLKIIRHLLYGVSTTQALSQEMKLSEAAISKHLKIMREAGMVKKTKNGSFIEYQFKTDVIDFIPYTFYETMMYQGKKEKRCGE